MNLPIPSGNVSLYNEAPGGVFILPTPMILGTGLIKDVRKAVTADMKAEDNRLYIIGETKDEMGGSLLFRKFGGKGGDVPGVDADNLIKMTDAVLEAMDGGLVKSCHDCSDGGLAVAAAEMCISGNIGVTMDLAGMGPLSMERKLFSESNTRWLAEVSDKDADAFQSIMGDGAVCIGRTGGNRFVVRDAIDLGVSDIRKAWNDPIWNIMGGVSE